MNIIKLITLLGLSFSLVGISNANPVLDRGTSVNVVVANEVQLDGSGSTPVVLQVVGPSLLSSAKIEGHFNQSAQSWVLVEFQRVVMPNGAEIVLGKVRGSDVYGSQSIEVLQAQRSQWAGFLGKGHIPAGTHFNLMLTTSLEVPSYSKQSLASIR